MEQICSICLIKKDISFFYIRKETGKSRKDCSACCSERSSKEAKIKSRNIKKHNYDIIFQQYKYCIRCKKDKLGKFFYKCLEKEDGLYTYCKDCDIKYARDKKYINESRYSEEELIKLNKKCKVCLFEQPLINFQIAPKCKLGRSNKCKKCCNIQNNITKNTKDGRLKTYKEAAKSRSISWNISDEQFFELWKSSCSYCGDNIETIGIDRVNSDIGYQINNIVPCCSTCNRMKLSMSQDDWINKMRNIINFVDSKK